MWEWRYSSTHSEPWHLTEVSDQLHTLANLPLGREPLVLLDSRFDGPQSRSGYNIYNFVVTAANTD